MILHHQKRGNVRQIWGTYVFLIICNNLDHFILFSGKTSKAGRLTKLSAVQILQEKFEHKAQLIEQEQELRRVELELQSRNLDQEEAACNQEQEERKRLELELDEWRTMLQLLKKHL